MKVLYILFIIIVINLKGHLTEISNKGYMAISPRILGGKPIKIQRAPYQVCIKHRLEDESYEFKCGGTLITSSRVLTAARCLFSDTDTMLESSVIRVFAGATYISGMLLYSDTVGVKPHPQYRKYHTISRNDIGVVMLKTPFKLNKYVNIIPLRRKALGDDLDCTITGWGKSRYGGQISEELMEGTVPIFNKRQCSMMYEVRTGHPLPPGVVCAGTEDGDVGACKGDNGGPLICDGQLSGILSYGKGCGGFTGAPSLYTLISYHRKWIMKRASGCKSLSFNLYLTLITVATVLYNIQLF